MLGLITMKGLMMAKYLIRKTAALLVAFSLPIAIAALPSIDRHDEHLNDAVAVQYQNKAEASKQYVDAAYDAMWERRATGDYGEVYEP